MPIGYFDGRWDLISGLGTLPLNDDGYAGGFYAIDPTGCSGAPVMRATVDNVPQADGSILHNRFLTGYQITLKIDLYKDSQTAACEDGLVQTMIDNLSRHLQYMLREQGRLTYDPGGGLATRLADELQTLLMPEVTVEDGLTSLRFQVDSPFPYTYDFEQTETTINATTDIITNTGSAPFYPVWRVYAGGSPLTDFTLANATTGLNFIWDSSLPGGTAIPAGEYAEIDTFRNVMYLNGDEDNLKAGIDIVNSQFWPLDVGANSITTDADARLLWQPAWV